MSADADPYLFHVSDGGSVSPQLGAKFRSQTSWFKFGFRHLPTEKALTFSKHLPLHLYARTLWWACHGLVAYALRWMTQGVRKPHQQLLLLLKLRASVKNAQAKNWIQRLPPSRTTILCSMTLFQLLHLFRLNLSLNIPPSVFNSRRLRRLATFAILPTSNTLLSRLGFCTHVTTCE